MALKRLCWNVFLHGFAFSSLFVLSASAGSTLKLDTSWKEYHNAQWGYCVSYPSRWFKGDAFDGAGFFVKVGIKKRSRPVGEIDIGALPSEAYGATQPAAFTLVNDLQVHLDGLKRFERAEQVEVLEKREMQLLGSSALFTKDRYYDPQDRARWVDEVVFANRNERLYRLELECRADQLTRFEPVFTHLVSTFQFQCSGAR